MNRRCHMVSVAEKGNRHYEGEGSALEQSADIADAFLTRATIDLVNRVDCWNKDKKGRTKCGCPSCNKREGAKVADEMNRTLAVKHSGRQANEFYVTDSGKSIKYRKLPDDET